MSIDQPTGPSIREWADTKLTVTKVEPKEGGPAIYRFEKEMVINGVRHVHFVWVNQLQLRGAGIDHGL